MYFKIIFILSIVGILMFNRVTDREGDIVAHGHELMHTALDKVKDGDYTSACDDMLEAVKILRDTKYFMQAADLKTKICGISEAIHEVKPDIII